MTHASHSAQAGMALIEALVAVLVFAVGVLAMIGMQTLAVKTGTDAKVRSDAAYLANQLISQMWADTRSNLPGYAYNCTDSTHGCAPVAADGSLNCAPGTGSTGTPPANVVNWLSQVSTLLPGATGSLVTISVVPMVPTGGSATGTNTYGNSYLVGITLCWQLPEDKNASPPKYRQYVTAAQIS